MLVVVLVGIGAPALAGAGPQKRERTPPPAAIEEPCLAAIAAPCRPALEPLYAALASAGTAPVRISWIGDSVTADDLILDRLRSTLQQRFGNGGPGFVYGVTPHPYCGHRVVKRTTRGRWAVRGAASTAPPDHLMGLGGSSAESSDGRITIEPGPAPIATAELFFLAQPDGGTLEVAAGQSALATIATAAPARQARFETVAVPAGAGPITLSADGRVRLFGVVLETGRGVVVDNLGLVNATAKSFARNRVDHWRGQLARRAPDLFVVMVGTNEAAWLPARGIALAEHERMVTQLVRTAREANPERSCLIISPRDQLDKRVAGNPPRASVAAMVAAQRRAAVIAGCAFWDTYHWMGGRGASGTWKKRGLLAGDFQHPTRRGSTWIADALTAGLLDGYAAWQRRAGQRVARAGPR